MTHLLVAFDGSDDGFEALSLLVSQFDRALPRRVTAAVVAWPLRESPIWERALERQVEFDDLHRSMAEVATRATRRLATLFSDPATVRQIVAEGKPSEQLLELATNDPADFALLGITGGRHREAMLAAMAAFIARAPMTVVVVHGRGTAEEPSES